jgi:protein TonB
MSALKNFLTKKHPYMLPEKIMQSDLLDILFDNRNKNYGAYTLRRSYNKIMMTSLSCTLFVALCFSFFQFLHHTKKETALTVNIIPPDAVLIKLPDVKPLPVEQTAVHKNQVINSTPVIAPDKQANLPPTTDELEKADIGSFKSSGTDDIGIIQPPAEEHGNGSQVSQLTAKIAEDKPVAFAEVMPEFPGGTDALIKFILKNIHQPGDLQAGEAIKVIASFVVSKTGNIENIKIVNAGRPDLNKEVLRVINKMPLWKPGLQNGKPVSVYFNLPVTFQSADE